MREIDFYMSILIKSAIIIDASSKFNGKTQDILIINGKIQEINSEINSKAKKIIDSSGLDVISAVGFKEAADKIYEAIN